DQPAVARRSAHGGDDEPRPGHPRGSSRGTHLLPSRRRSGDRPALGRGSETSMTRCVNGCDDGWRSVDARWVEAQAPMPDPPGDDATDAQLDEWQRAVDYAHTRRKSLANTVYPCDRCRPELFARWAAGHLDPDHNSSSCSECRDVRRGRAP